MNNEEKNKDTNENEMQENTSVTEETTSGSAEENPEDEKQNENPEKVLQAKIDELNDRYIRLYSEFDNFRKRSVRERMELHKVAGEEIIKSLLPVLDDFERALQAMSTANENSSTKEGVELIYQKLKNNLTQKGLTEMESKNLEFNPDIHEAITSLPAPTEDMKGKVVEEVEKGYYLNGKVIRFAKVIVGN